VDFDFDFALEIAPVILGALGTTLVVTCLSSAGASLLGFLLAILLRSNPYVAIPARFIIDVIRSTPVLVQIYFMYFVLPQYGVSLPSFVVGVLSLSIYYSGYLAEVFKGGIDSVAHGQYEGGISLGLTPLQVFVLIIGPQVVRNVAPTLGTYFISILKATPYLEVIAVNEILGQAMDISSQTFRYAEPVSVAGIVYLVLALSIGQLIGWLERRMSRKYNRSQP
jgi:polar amino acid transport system permease protein